MTRKNLPDPNDARLTYREREVVELAKCGKSDKEISRALGIAHFTVKVHIQNARLRIREGIAAQ